MKGWNNHTESFVEYFTSSQNIFHFIWPRFFSAEFVNILEIESVGVKINYSLQGDAAKFQKEGETTLF